MKSLPILLRNTLIAGLLGVLTTPADAAVRSNLFGRSSRSMMGMGDGGQGELYTVTPGVKSFKAQLKGIGSMGYASGGKRFTMNFARNNPRSMRSPNGRMTFTGLRGGGMRIFMRSLRGAKVGKPMVINPSGALSERGGTAPSESFRFTGFDGFRFTREQLLNDVGVYGAPLAKLVSSGFSSVNTFFQRLATALVIQQDPGTFDSQGPDYIAGTLNDASLGIISGYTDPTASQTILTSQFDLAAFLNPILQTRDLDGDGAVGDFDDRKLLVKIQKFIASNADKILEFLIQYAVQADVQGSVDTRNSDSYTPVDPNSPGSIEFTSSVVSFLENAGASYVYVTRNGGSLGEATATVSLDALTEPDASIFRFSTQTVKWLAGESGPKAILVKVIDDRAEDGDQGLDLTITAATGAVVGSLSTSSVSIIDNDGEFTDSAIAVARNALLVLEYSWPRNQRDLDTFTIFEENVVVPTAAVGYTPDRVALFAPYMSWSGDDTNGGGKEVVVIDLDSAISDGLLSPFNIECRADWYHYTNDHGEGPATLTVYFRDKVTAKTSPKASTEILPNLYLPAGGTSGAETHVADIDIQYEATAGTVEFSLTPILPSL